MSSVSGITNYNYYDYNSWQSVSSSWTDKANSETEKLKESLGIKDTGSTGSTSSSSQSAGSVSGFLLGYQTRLEDLESAAGKLQFYQKDNVLDKFDKALADVAANPENGTASATKAQDDVISAVGDLVKKYNDTISYLKSNTGLGSGITDQIETLKRAMPSEKTLKAIGISYDTSGNMKFDESALRTAMDNALNKAVGAEEDFDLDADWGVEWEQAKDIIGGQYGIADRVGAKATFILDSSVDRIVGGSSSSTSDTKDSTDSSNKTTSSNSVSAATTKSSGMSDSFMQFASFAKSGAFNLSNYYAVSMLNILV